MKTLSHSALRIIGTRYSPSYLARVRSFIETPVASFARLLLLIAGLAAVFAAPGWTEPLQEGITTQRTGPASRSSPPEARDPDSVARHNWRKYMGENRRSEKGCFHASYPSTLWEKVDCKAAPPPIHAIHVAPSVGNLQTVGDGHDYVASAQGLITEAIGEFGASGVRSESSVGVAQFGGGGILGTSEYSVQLNTNANKTTSVCAGHSGCTVWQQFVYGTDYVQRGFTFFTDTYPGVAGLFIQYWLLNWGWSDCPAGWYQYEVDCVLNSAVVPTPDMPLSDLGDMEIIATAAAGGNDTLDFSYSSEIYSLTAPDTVLDIGSVWTQTEFNIVGDAGGSEAEFNAGSSITAYLLLKDGSNSPPACIENAGTTGETNNLNLGSCSTSVFWGFPYIYFTESN